MTRRTGLGTAANVVDGRDLLGRGATTDVVDPFTEQVVGVTPESDAAEVAAAVESAVTAAASWSSTSADERAGLLRAFADALEKRSADTATLVASEMGMPLALATASQGDLPPRVLRSFADATEQIAWQEQVPGATVHRLPRGVVGAITPWNMPVHQVIAKVGAALAAGNAVVLKPSELTPFDAVAVVEAALDAGLPGGVLNLVHGTGPGAGPAPAAHPAVDHVSFTGSVVGGQAVGVTAARRAAPVTLELGGKSAAIVLDDADLDVAVPGVVRSGLVNSGQACNAPTRLLVPADRLADVLERLRATIDGLVAGDPLDPATTFGPLASRRQQQRVLDMIAAGEGHDPIVGAIDLPDHGWFVAPHVFVGLPSAHPLMRDEVFGPVLVVGTYDGDDLSAAAAANDSDYGLSAEVWSADADRASQLAGHLRVGQVKINGVRTRENPGVPFGGFKLSGHGRELGAEGVLDMTTTRAVMRP